MKKFKKVYVEITNICNLNCNFCIKTKKKKEVMSKERFTHILRELQDITEYLNFHILGEPLMHPLINEFIDIASKDFKINITTNGYLIENIANNKNIRQINISLHSFDDSINLNKYLDQIFQTTEKLLKSGTIINYRIWTENPYADEIIMKLNKFYNVDIILTKTFKIKSQVYISKEKEFIWPAISKQNGNKNGTCHGLKTHFGVLVDGTVVPCCLDAKGIINLGNIFKTDITTILNSNRVLTIIDNFNNNIKCELLCQNCSFYDNRKTKHLEKNKNSC